MGQQQYRPVGLEGLTYTHLAAAVLLRTLNHSLWALVGLEAVTRVDAVVSWLQSVGF